MIRDYYAYSQLYASYVYIARGTMSDYQKLLQTTVQTMRDFYRPQVTIRDYNALRETKRLLENLRAYERP